MKAKSKIEPGRPEFMIGAHCLNHNAHLNPQKACPCIENVAREYASLNDVRACSRLTK